MAERPDIATAAGKAQEITSDGQTIKRRPIKDLIELDEHITGQNAVKKKKTLFAPVKFGGTH